MHNKRKLIAVFDTETVGSLASPFIYDIGLIIADKKGKIYHSQRWIINEVFDNTPLMQSSPFLKPATFTMYRQQLSLPHGRPFHIVQTEINNLLEQYDVQTISAYNVGFDLRALAVTTMEFLGVKNFFTKEYQILCLWNMACETILAQKTFLRYAHKYDWRSKSGKNIGTSAEIAYRYISNQPSYIEPHTALEDCEIEVAIMAHCFRQHKRTTYGVQAHPWRKVKG